MATRQTDLQRDMAFGQVAMITAIPDEDMKHNIDCVLVFKSGYILHLALRTRRISLEKYGQISIRYRRKSGTPTEIDKILNGESEADFYIFDFTDAVVICKLDDIKTLLVNGPTEVVANRDRQTEAVYINITDLPCLVITKSKGEL